MESTVLSVGKSVLSGALGYAKSAVAEEVALQLGIQRDQAFIRGELEMMQAFLMAAHEERDDNKVVKTWVKQVRDVAYNVEDCLQDFAVRLEKLSWWRIPCTLLDRRRVAKEMKELRAQVEDVSQRNVRYRLIKGSGSKPATAAGQSNITAAAIFGMDEARRAAKKDKAKVDLFQLINMKDNDLRVIAVCGTSADLGQTSIINAVYENLEIKSKFACRAWVRVMHPFNPKDFIQSLVEQFHTATGVDVMLETEKTGRELAQEFNGYVNEKRYLIVLNNLTTIEEWNRVKKCFPNNQKGSRIIVSTSQVEVASLCAGQESIVSELKQWSADQNIYAFYEKVFKETVDLDKQYPELVEQAELILRKCKGLPLAIVTIGGFLSNQPKTAMEWRKLNEHISSELELNPELETIRTVLVKSYDGLPYHLKSCFLYLSIFPEDHKVSRRRLVRRWTAEGYSRKVRSKSAEEIADNYFMELISRSMILPSQQSIHSRKGIDSCQVHDLIREIGISKSMEENLVFRLEEGCSSNTQGKIRHLAISSNWEGDKSEFENIVDMSSIRSLTVFGKWRPFFISDKMRFLRVLDLEDTSSLVNHHLENIGKLLHLIYLSLRGCIGIYHLPDSLGMLRQLQTLDITCTNIMKLPKTMIRLRKLRHILAGSVNDKDDERGKDMSKLMTNKLGIMIFSPVVFCVVCCAPRLLKGLKSIEGDPNRRDVCTVCCCSLLPLLWTRQSLSGVAVPRGIRKLKDLHTLSIANVSRGKAVLEDIKRLTRLRKLGVTGISKRNGQEFCSAIAGLSCLESLLVQSEGKPGLFGCLDGPSSPPKNLQSLKLYGNLVKLPEWIEGLKNLVKLKLRSSRILEHDAAIQVLGKLPNLAILRLCYKSFKGEEVRFSIHHDTFPSLKVLELFHLGNLTAVEFEGGATPKLELLQFCSRISNPKVGLFSRLPSLPSLKEFMLDNYSYADEFVEYLRGQLAENPNRPVLKRF